MTAPATITPKTIRIKGKEYVDVAERSRIAHAAHGGYKMLGSTPLEVAGRPHWQVIVEIDGMPYIGTSQIKFDAAKGTADGDNPVECAETSALGRALGFGGQAAAQSIASADEMLRTIGGMLSAVISTLKDWYPQAANDGKIDGLTLAQAVDLLAKGQPVKGGK